MTFLIAANISCGVCFVKMASKTLLQSVDGRTFDFYKKIR